MKKIFLFITILFLFGCNEKTYTVDEFSADKELLDTYNRKCKNGEIDGNSLNCQNVHKARVLKNKVDNASWN